MSDPILQTGVLIARGEKWALFDFGKAAFGQLSLDLQTKFGGFVSIAVGECLKAGRLDQTPGSCRIYYAQSVFVGRKDHVDLEFPEHRPLRRFHKSRPLSEGEIYPFRYAEIQGDLLEISVFRKAYFGDFNDDAASFVSSDEKLNQVWEFCKYSIKATNCFEHYIDGNRERLPYEADAYINQLGHFCCDCSYHKARHTIEHLLQFPTWPMEYRTLMPAIVRDYVLYSGDTAALAPWKEPLREFLLEKYWMPDGRLPEKADLIVNNEIFRVMVDWPVNCRDNCQFGDGMTVSSAYLYHALLCYDELYHVPELKEQALKLRQELLDSRTGGLFPDFPGSTHCSLHSQMFPAYFGIAGNEVLDCLRRKGMACSVYGAQFLIGALFQLRDAETALRLLTAEDEPGWLHMLAEGSTISMEAWSNAAKPNQDWNHPWGAAPANLIPRFFCGIRPTAPGFRRFIIDPQPGCVESFTMRHPTIAGPVELEYGRGKAKLTVPEGTTALFRDRELKAGVHSLVL